VQARGDAQDECVWRERLSGVAGGDQRAGTLWWFFPTVRFLAFQ
jgi:hypothetical protein